MAELKTDRELLREYAEDATESAFSTLVERHLNLVFATAIRRVRESYSALQIAGHQPVRLGSGRGRSSNYVSSLIKAFSTLSYCGNEL